MLEKSIGELCGWLAFWSEAAAKARVRAGQGAAAKSITPSSGAPWSIVAESWAKVWRESPLAESLKGGAAALKEARSQAWVRYARTATEGSAKKGHSFTRLPAARTLNAVPNQSGGVTAAGDTIAEAYAEKFGKLWQAQEQPQARLQWQRGLGEPPPPLTASDLSDAAAAFGKGSAAGPDGWAM